jgi:pSer/pThr/pTyr-binding forkhead associated (FHA) protein
MSSVPVRLICTRALGGDEIIDVSAGGICGRDPAVDFVLDHPTVSRRHARITVSGQVVEIQDLGSANGSWINGESLAQRPYPLLDGDRLRLGQLELTVRIGHAEASCDGTKPVPATQPGHTIHGELPRAQPQMLLARMVQKRMVSIDPPPLPGYEIGQLILPALGVGGDILHWGIGHDGRRALVIGDVCGKGIAAAMYMAFVSGLLYEVVSASGSPEGVLRRVNRVLHPVMEPGMFVTMQAVFIDTRTHTVEIASAGHAPPMLRLANGHSVELGIDGGLALGPEADTMLGLLEVTLRPGEILLLTTDGVEESRDPEGREFGRGRMLAMLASATSAASLARSIEDAVFAHSGDAPQHDDLTLVTIGRVS